MRPRSPPTTGQALTGRPRERSPRLVEHSPCSPRDDLAAAAEKAAVWTRHVGSGGERLRVRLPEPDEPTGDAPLHVPGPPVVECLLLDARRVKARPRRARPQPAPVEHGAVARAAHFSLRSLADRASVARVVLVAEAAREGPLDAFAAHDLDERRGHEPLTVADERSHEACVLDQRSDPRLPMTGVHEAPLDAATVEEGGSLHELGGEDGAEVLRDRELVPRRREEARAEELPRVEEPRRPVVRLRDRRSLSGPET